MLPGMVNYADSVSNATSAMGNVGYGSDGTYCGADCRFRHACVCRGPHRERVRVCVCVCAALASMQTISQNTQTFMEDDIPSY